MVKAMKLKVNRLLLGGLGCLLAIMAAFVPSLATAQSGNLIKIDGSSTVFPITEAVAEEFQKTPGASRVTVGISGTGGGFRKFCAGETDIQNASRPIRRAEMATCKNNGIGYIELPVAYDALTVVVNPSSPVTQITTEELKKIWEPSAQGRITKWNQVNPSWPDAAFKLYGPGADSGTFDYFTEAIIGRAGQSRTDYTASEDDNVLVQGVSQDIAGLGYFGLAYYEENKSRLKGLAISHKGKPAVLPSVETTQNGTYVPLSRPILIYIKDTAARRQDVKDFVTFYLRNGSRLITEVGYVPLPARAYTTALGIFRSGRRGTAFGGETPVGLSIDEMLAREARS